MKVEIEIDQLAIDPSDKIDHNALRQVIEQVLAEPLQSALRGLQPARHMTVAEPIALALDSITETVVSTWQRVGGS